MRESSRLEDNLDKMILDEQNKKPHPMESMGGGCFKNSKETWIHVELDLLEIDVAIDSLRIVRQHETSHNFEAAYVERNVRELRCRASAAETLKLSLGALEGCQKFDNRARESQERNKRPLVAKLKAEVPVMSVSARTLQSDCPKWMIRQRMSSAESHVEGSTLERGYPFWQMGKVEPEVLAKVGTVAYKLELPQQLSIVHSTFHVSNLKKCLSDESLVILLDEIQIDDKLHFVEEPVEIMD
ncbi:hypothetical protein Tco_0723340 [Tanacetum coccineum]